MKDNKSIVISLDMYCFNEHAQTVIDNLGIRYTHCLCHSISEKWTFWNCANIPPVLPKGLEISKKDPFEYIGFGFDNETANDVLNNK